MPGTPAPCDIPVCFLVYYCLVALSSQMMLGFTAVLQLQNYISSIFVLKTENKLSHLPLFLIDIA